LLNSSVISLVCLGYIDQACSRSGTALAEARRLGHPFTLADTLVFVCVTTWCVGSGFESRLRCADELLALSVEHGFETHRAAGLVVRGWCLTALGHADEGIPLLTTGSAVLEEFGIMNWRPWVLAELTDARRMAGQWQAALGHLAASQRLAEETRNPWFQAETLRLHGDVLLATGDPAAAEASYHEAIAIAQQQRAKLWELRAAMSLARLWRDQGKRTAACDLLAPVYDGFTEGFGTPVLQEAKALLEELAR
jgi:predicted ATPase